MSEELPYTMTQCRGVGGDCPKALTLEGGSLKTALLPGLERALAASSWLRHLAAQGRSLSPHHRLRVAVSGCANGCSRPQTADFGFLAASTPLPPHSCSGCGSCEAACPDGLVRLHRGAQGIAPVIDMERCLHCGLCAAACAEGSMAGAPAGLRVQIGGKLGRRPLLAAELPGIFEPEAAVTIMEQSLEALWRRNQSGPQLYRMADLRREQGLTFLEHHEEGQAGNAAGAPL